MGFIDNIRDTLEDITSLEVVTLHGGDVVLNQAIDAEAKNEIEAKIAEQQAKLKAARTAYLNAEDKSDKRKKKKEYRAEKRDLNDLRAELLAVSPRDIFGKVEVAMGEASTVGYAKYEFGGDSVNYINSGISPEQEYLREAHAKNVASAVEVRQQLLDLAKSLLGKGTDL